MRSFNIFFSSHSISPSLSPSHPFIAPWWCLEQRANSGRARCFIAEPISAPHFSARVNCSITSEKNGCAHSTPHAGDTSLRMQIPTLGFDALFFCCFKSQFSHLFSSLRLQKYLNSSSRKQHIPASSKLTHVFVLFWAVFSIAGSTQVCTREEKNVVEEAKEHLWDEAQPRDFDNFRRWIAACCIQRTGVELRRITKRLKNNFESISGETIELMWRICNINAY